MSMSEMFFMIFPVVWVTAEAVFLKKKNIFEWSLPWVMLGASCFLVSFLLGRKLSVMMGGTLLWQEVLYYGWFLFALFVLLRAFKKGVLFILEQVVPFSQLSSRQSFIATISLVISLIIAVPFFLAMTSIHRQKIGNAFNPREMFGLEYEDIILRARDGINIKAWFVPAKSDKAVIIAHGLGANRSNFISTVGMWNQLGFNVLIFDLRGHGDSGGHTVSFGYKERYDVLAALDYLTNQKEFRPVNVWGYGVSFGGAAMIYAAQETPQLRALIIDSSFADLEHMAAKVIKDQPIVPVFCRGLVKEIGLFFMQLDLGFDLRKHSPRNSVRQLSGLPVLFIHGKGDPLIPWTETQLLYENAAGPKQRVFFNTQGHYGTPNDPDYISVIEKFIAQTETAYAKEL